MVPLVTLVETLAHLAPWSRGWSTSPMRTGLHPAHPASRPSLCLTAVGMGYRHASLVPFLGSSFIAYAGAARPPRAGLRATEAEPEAPSPS